MSAITQRLKSRVTALAVIAALCGCATTSGVAPPESPQPVQPIAEPAGRKVVSPADLGIEITAMRLASAGYMLDFRFRVHDSVKAAVMFDRKVNPILFHKESGTHVAVPRPAIIGALRATSRGTPMPADRGYYMLFANPGKTIQPGSQVTMILGDMAIEPLIVQ